ncbi:1-acyl-sn-glycerol-3-phosphate acyltransferase [Paracoccus isoporae]|uniref:1-acyl-sn-glycerol-3-phosphate acyltransferase n=1 Tax=Paracoccus isoporae TaxID=591205 RepID=A0A1G7A2G2_9RHOB|nr:lysophospholipid acyltransferase family protein [Paracoccus isoporae]SDE09148.1 1-acyl-sn-glycerol-3-phosphate acyltransferase [Paracoccus isoporae]
MADEKISQPGWIGDPPPVTPPPGWRVWLRILRRGVPAIGILALGVPVLVLLRAVERVFAGPRRPVTGPFVQMVCRGVLFAIGLRWRRIGRPMTGPGAVVANHSSWLDIFTLNSAMPVFFVAKSEVSTWPGINILTRVTDTHFVARDRRFAAAQSAQFASRTRNGHRLLFFPEGTSSDGIRVLPFKPTLFQGFLDPDLPRDLAVQPVTAIYHAPENSDPRIYGWWGDMALGPHILAVLALKRQGRVDIVLHEPVPVGGKDRKTLSRLTEEAVRGALPFAQG